MTPDPGHGWCPKCAKPLVSELTRSEPHCPQHGYVVDKIYRCHCGRPEEFRAIDNVPQYCHYCGSCAAALMDDVRAHLERVVARSTPTTGPWRPA
jgi:hypothetical protein